MRQPTTSSPSDFPLEEEAELLRAAGWRVRYRATSELRHLLIEADHPLGGDVMVTRSRGRRRYVLHEEPWGRHWLRVSPEWFQYFVQHRALPSTSVVGVRQPWKRCECGTKQHLTERDALDDLLQQKVAVALAGRPDRRDNTVWPCPDDARVWHLTKRRNRTRRDAAGGR